MKVKIIEILSESIEVDAVSKEDAIEQVEKMYYDSEIVLDYANYYKTTIEIEEENFFSKKDNLINKVIEYLLETEKKHYEESGEAKNHIYNTLLELKAMID